MKTKTPKPGDTRDRRRFLVFPITIGRLTRWLEIASWREEWTDGAAVVCHGRNQNSPRWTPTAWLDVPECEWSEPETPMPRFIRAPEAP